jgi:hypothetical protein
MAAPTLAALSHTVHLHGAGAYAATTESFLSDRKERTKPQRIRPMPK